MFNIQLVAKLHWGHLYWTPVTVETDGTLDLFGTDLTAVADGTIGSDGTGWTLVTDGTLDSFGTDGTLLTFCGVKVWVHCWQVGGFSPLSILLRSSTLQRFLALFSRIFISLRLWDRTFSNDFSSLAFLSYSLWILALALLLSLSFLLRVLISLEILPKWFLSSLI